MKILHVSSGEQYGGIEAVLVSLARHAALCPGLTQQFAVCFEGRLSEELQAIGAPVYRLGMVRLKRPLTVRRARRALRAAIGMSGCDLVVCHGPRSMPFFAPAVRASGLPLVMWAHGRGTHRWWLRWLLRRNRPDLLVCNSRFTQQAIAHLFPDCQSTVIYSPLDVQPSSADPESRAAPRRTTGAGDADTVIVMAGRMVPRKGHRVLVNALALLPKETSWKCWIIGGAQSGGEKRYVHDLENRVFQAGLGDRVHFLGQRSDVPALMAAADIFCLPNLQTESFGVVFIEAMRAGLPVVTSKIGSAIEIFGEGSGLLAVPGDAAVLAGMLRNLIFDPELRRRAGAGGPARARQLCDPQARLGELRTALESLYPAVPGKRTP